MLDGDSGTYPDPIGQSGGVATGIDGHVVPALTQCPGELCNVHILAT
jgi:hypothetical protein